MGVLQKINANFYEKSLHRIYLIMIKLQQGKYCAQIAKELGLKHQIVSYYIKKLERLGYLEHKIDSSIRLYGLTPLGRQFLALIKHSAVQKSSLRVKNIRVHRLVIKFKIIKDNPKAKFAKQISLNNWVKQSEEINFPIGITIEKTPQHIILYIHQFQTQPRAFFSQFMQNCLRAIFYVCHLLAREKGIIIDVLSGKIISQHISNEFPCFNSLIPKHTTAEVNLKRKARGIYPTTMKARAWLDRSYGNVEIETNDLLYQEKLLLLPEIVYEIKQYSEKTHRLVEKLCKNIKKQKGKINKKS